MELFEVLLSQAAFSRRPVAFYRKLFGYQLSVSPFKIKATSAAFQNKSRNLNAFIQSVRREFIVSVISDGEFYDDIRTSGCVI